MIPGDPAPGFLDALIEDGAGDRTFVDVYPDGTGCGALF